MSRKRSKSKKKQIFIEFVGIPGSGKTTLSHRAAQLIREKGIAILEPAYSINNEIPTIQRYLIKLWYSTRLMLLRPIWALDWLFLVIQSRQTTLTDFVLMSINGFFVLDIYRQHSRGHYISFLDQGICQAFLSLSYKSKTDYLLKRQLITVLCFLSRFEFRIIHIEANIDSITQRLKTRKERRSRLELVSSTADLVKIIRAEKRKIEYLLKTLSTELQADIISNLKIGSEDIHSAAQQIVALFIDRLANPHF